MQETSLENTLITLRDGFKGKNPQEKIDFFNSLELEQARELFVFSDIEDQALLLSAIPIREKKKLLRYLPPDDIVDLMQFLSDEGSHQEVLALIDESKRAEIRSLLSYKEDVAGGFMTPRFIRVSPDLSVDEALKVVKQQSRSKAEMVYYCYVLDTDDKLLGVISLRQLIIAGAEEIIRNVMRPSIVTVDEFSSMEDVSRVFYATDLLSIPVVDAQMVMKGIITFDDVFDAVEEEATKDIQMMGGQEALEQSYANTSWVEMVRKRAGWLVVLFLGETITAYAMASFEDELAKVVSLAMFIPLIISSGGNSGSQASTLVIRALALGEIETKHWFKIFAREFISGAALGIILGVIGFLKILLMDKGADISLTVGLALVGVVLWGTLAGSMLPLVLKRMGFDPATASAPFVATLVDVTGIVLYFSFAKMILGGLLN